MTKNNEVHELAIQYNKETDFKHWYPDVIQKAEMIEYYEISGCYILRPNAFFIWEQVQKFIDSRIKKLGVQNAYFPLFVSKDALEKEKDHVEGFAPEVAWVTRAGDTDLAKPIAIRPTSETIMYPAYAKWIRSHRDLPLKLNQWTSVVRWEFKYPTPFIRTREFCWQEGHTAHATMEEAQVMVNQALDIYESCYQDLMAVPVIKGVKSEKEKFAGGHLTTTVEAFIPTNGRAVQGATSHHLGTNFSEMFNIQFEDDSQEKKGKKHACQTSWGFTTRSIGVMIMLHGDNKGMVLPPRVANNQIVIVPIPGKKDSAKSDELAPKAHEIAEMLKDDKLAQARWGGNIRVTVDDRKNYNPGFKYNYHELRGCPIRIEIGERDLEKESVMVCTRYNAGTKESKFTLKMSELETEIPKLLDTIHNNMLENAMKKRDASIVICTSFEEMVEKLDQKVLFLVPWCETIESEEEIKAQTKEISEKKDADNKELRKKEELTDENGETFADALSGAIKTLCIPLIQPEMPKGQMCFFKKNVPAKRWCLMGRSY